MNLPIRTFWLMNGNIVRLMAEKDLRATDVQLARHGGEGREAIRKNLTLELGNVGKVAVEESPLEAERDEQGFAELKALAALA